MRQKFRKPVPRDTGPVCVRRMFTTMKTKSTTNRVTSNMCPFTTKEGGEARKYRDGIRLSQREFLKIWNDGLAGSDDLEGITGIRGH